MTSNMPEKLIVGSLDTPIGTAVVAVDEKDVLRALFFEDFPARMHRCLRLHYSTLPIEQDAPPAFIRRALSAYFDGDNGALAGLAWATGGTAFQRKVWSALTEIPAGTTLSYGALAVKIGMPKAVRAVGLANGANPISIIVPCHRVIGADGSLTGYGGGLHRKQWLLTHEGALAAGQARLL